MSAPPRAGGVAIRKRRPSDVELLGALVRRDRLRTGYPHIEPVDPTAWIAPDDDLAAFVAVDTAELLLGHVAIASAVDLDHGTGSALRDAWAAAHGRDIAECAVISRLLVSADHQRQGVGGRLLERAVGWIEGRGMGPCLDVLPLPDDRALRFYERLGWVRVAELRAHWHRPGWPPLVGLVLPTQLPALPG